VEQVNEYYAFGLKQKSNGFEKQGSAKNSWLYNGKELQDELNIGWYDYGARMYMSDLGRWGVTDPMSEKYRRWSPYAYAMNNPVRYIDPDGMEVYYGFEAQKMFEALQQQMDKHENQVKEDPKAAVEDEKVTNEGDQQGAPQEGYQEINRRFRADFVRYFFFSIPYNVHRDLSDEQRLKMINKNIHRVKDNYLDDQDGEYQMRALYYTIDSEDSDGKIDLKKTKTEYLIDPSEWTADPIWANPGHLGPNRTVMPTKIETESGAILINVYFQKVPQPISM
jgi:RHS repeat-associated protein